MHISLEQARDALQIASAFRDCQGRHPMSNALIAGGLARLFDADFVAINIWDASTASYLEGECAGRDVAIKAAYHENFQFIDPFRHRSRQRAGQASCLSRMISLRELHRDRYYVDHLRTFGLEDGVELVLRDTTSRDIVGDVRLWRGKCRQKFGEREEQLLELLHVSALDALVRFRETQQTGRISKASELPMLTPKESETLMRLANGLSDKQIARDMGVSYWTVRTHVAALLRKLGATNRTALATLQRQTLGS